MSLGAKVQILHLVPSTYDLGLYYEVQISNFVTSRPANEPTANLWEKQSGSRCPTAYMTMMMMYVKYIAQKNRYFYKEELTPIGFSTLLISRRALDTL